jgi:hypothetical protein
VLLNCDVWIGKVLEGSWGLLAVMLGVLQVFHDGVLWRKAMSGHGIGAGKGLEESRDF